jgi:serine phosphatase RsbU (regulator of sigma subunit)
MLKLADFFHLPELDAAVAQLLADRPGLIVVAGLDPRPAAADALPPSGRATIFRILLNELLDARARSTAVVVAPDRSVVRVPRGAGRRISFALTEPPADYPSQIAAAAARRPDLLVVDRLCAASVRPALDAAHAGVRVLAQLDTVFRGAGVLRELQELGADPATLGAVTWVVGVQRLATLCAHCRRRSPDAPEFFVAHGCPECGNTGRAGEIALFDLFRAADLAAENTEVSEMRDERGPHLATATLRTGGFPSSVLSAPSVAGTAVLALEDYAAGLAREGFLAHEDVLALADDQIRRTYRLLTASEAALTRSNAALERKVVELETANRVLEQRTAALLSLQDIGSALIGTGGLKELLGRVCRYARELCGADRAILYLRHAEEAEVLAVSGWEQELLHRRLPNGEVFDGQGTAARPFRGWPPGVPARHADVAGGKLRAGLVVPLIAQDAQVGLMVVHTTLKARFTPGEVALLSTFANQAALSIQRARLVEQLRLKIAMLEEAQAALVSKERLEREMELAHDVQQSVLPRVFPPAPGLVFAARNEPARQVGGDLYDVIRLDERRFGLVIADVSGKGMPAALYMALARSLLLAEARREPSPRAVLLSVNRLLRELGEPHMFVTVFYGVIDIDDRSLVYCRAGHDYPVLLRAGGVQTLDAEGTVLGFFDERELRLEEDRVQLVPGDRLVLYTDGLTDMLNDDGRRFELPQLEALLVANAHRSAGELLDATFAALRAYQGNAVQYDDMTMLVAEVTDRPHAWREK